MKITSPPNSHPFCKEAVALAERIASIINMEGYDADINVDPYTLCSNGEVNINCKVRLKTKI